MSDEKGRRVRKGGIVKVDIFRSTQKLNYILTENYNYSNVDIKDTLMLTENDLSLIIVKIDSVTPSFCLRHYVQNGLSYSAEETRLTLCKPIPSSQLGIRSKRTNKHQLLLRIASVKTPLIYNIIVDIEDCAFMLLNVELKINALCQP